MKQEISFFDWMKVRIKNLILSEFDYTGDIFMWNDYKEKKNSQNYCVYQTEVLHLTHKLTPEYRNFLDNAKYVFDYSTENIKIYQRAIHLPIKIEKIPPINNINNNLIFYGYITDRRRKILNEIQKNKIPIKITDGQYGKNYGIILQKKLF